MTSADEPVNDRPIFVLGCPRSGTTLLQVMLSAHPRIAIPPETRFVMSAYYRRREWGDLRRRENRLALARWIVTSEETKFKGLRLSRTKAVAEILDGPPTVGSAVGILLRAYARESGKPRWGDKRPAYHQDVGALLRMFPDAQLVHVVRDGRDCVASLKRMPWFQGDVAAAVHAWGYAVEAGRRWQRKLSADSWHEVVYERLVSKPGKELRALCAYLGEDFHDNMLCPQLIAPSAVPFQVPWHARLGREVDGARVGSYSHGLDADELGLMEAVNSRRLLRHGYALSGQGRRPSPVLLGRYAFAATRQQAAIERRHLVDALERRRRPTTLTARLTTRQLALTPGPTGKG